MIEKQPVSSIEDFQEKINKEFSEASDRLMVGIWSVNEDGVLRFFQITHNFPLFQMSNAINQLVQHCKAQEPIEPDPLPPADIDWNDTMAEGGLNIFKHGGEL